MNLCKHFVNRYNQESKAHVHYLRCFSYNLPEYTTIQLQAETIAKITFFIVVNLSSFVVLQNPREEQNGDE